MKPLILAIVPTIMQCQMNKNLRVEVKNRIVPLKVSIPIVKEKFQNRQIQALCSVSILIRDKTQSRDTSSSSVEHGKIPIQTHSSTIVSEYIDKARIFYKLIYKPSYCNFPESRNKNKISKIFFLF